MSDAAVGYWKDREIPRVEFLGMPFHRLTKSEAIAWMEERIRQRLPSMVFCPNVALVVWARKDQELRDIYARCDLLPVDGMGIYYASQLTGHRFPEACSGHLLMFEVLKRANEKAYRVFFLGTKPEILQRAIANIRTQYPGMQVAGSHHGYFSEAEAPAVAQVVAESRGRVEILVLEREVNDGAVKRRVAQARTGGHVPHADDTVRVAHNDGA